jgi:hypothetical protein
MTHTILLLIVFFLAVQGRLVFGGFVNSLALALVRRCGRFAVLSHVDVGPGGNEC